MATKYTAGQKQLVNKLKAAKTPVKVSSKPQTGWDKAYTAYNKGSTQPTYTYKSGGNSINSMVDQVESIARRAASFKRQQSSGVNQNLESARINEQRRATEAAALSAANAARLAMTPRGGSLAGSAEQYNARASALTDITNDRNFQRASQWDQVRWQSKLQNERSQQGISAQREAATQALERGKQDIEGRSRLQGESTNQQSRLQSERSSQALEAARLAGDTQSRLQRERSDQGLTAQREAATQALERGKQDIEGRSRLQGEGATQRLQSQREATDQQSRLQRERSDQSLVSQRAGIEGQSRLQRERTEQASKLQTQAAAEAAARTKSNRVAAINALKNLGRGR